nr:tetratricopeptide repeat protein [uncultured Desulfobulbus sp.]
MKKIRNIALAGCSLVLLTQCATQEELHSLQVQLRAMNQKLEDVKSTTVNQMQRRQANSVTKIDQVESETMRIRSSLQENQGQTERFRSEVEQNINELRAAVEGNRQETAEQFAQVEKRMSVWEQKFNVAVDNLQQQRVDDAKRRAREAEKRAIELQRRANDKSQSAPAASLQPGENGLPSGQLVRLAPRGKKARLASPPEVEENTVTSASSAVQPATNSIPKQPASSPQVESSSPVKITPVAQADPFAKAMDAFNRKEYKSAYKNFEQTLAADPNGPKAGKTLFYMGESLFNQGEYDLAILDYQKVISNHSQDAHTPRALLKQGMAFEQLTDSETAKIIYKKLISDHAGSQEAKEAKERLGKL